MSDDLISAQETREFLEAELAKELEALDQQSLERVKILAPRSTPARIRWIRDALSIGGLRRKAAEADAEKAAEDAYYRDLYPSMFGDKAR